MDPNEQTIEMQAVLKLEKALRRHIRDDKERFAKIDDQLQGIKVRLQVLIPLVVSAAIAAYFGAHG